MARGDVLDVVESLRTVSVATLCSAYPAAAVMSSEIRSLVPGAHAIGPAHTVSTPQGDNAAIHRAVAAAEPGQILIVDAGAEMAVGHFGDLLASACQRRGVVGLVIDGAVRDAAALRELSFPTFARGVNPRGPRKDGPGVVGGAIVCGGVTVRPGDIVAADDDGIVVIEGGMASALPPLVRTVIERELYVRDGIAGGVSTCELLRIPPDEGEQGRLASGAPRARATPHFFNLDHPAQGVPRELAPGITARVFAGEHAMLSVVTFAPNACGVLHSHPEEQWGLLLEGEAVRIQGGEEILVRPHSFWRTPGGMPHTMRAGPRGARVLDVFSPPREAYLAPGRGFGVTAV